MAPTVCWQGALLNERVIISYCKIQNHLHLGKWTEILQMGGFMSSEQKMIHLAC